jgi:hypothetical protein
VAGSRKQLNLHQCKAGIRAGIFWILNRKENRMQKFIGVGIVMLVLSFPGFTQEQLELEIIPGEHWIGEGTVFFFVKIEVEPTFAVWMENTNGEFIETLYVTGKAASGEWNATKGRPEALPIWGRKAMAMPQENGLYLPSKNAPLPDAISGATPMEDARIPLTPASVLPPGSYRVYMEINIAFDYNETWRKGLRKTNRFYNGENGQPSLLLQADIEIGDGIARSVTLVPVGTGSPMGTDGTVYPIEGIDSALHIADRIALHKAAR